MINPKQKYIGESIAEEIGSVTMWTRNGITKGGERHRTGMRTYCSVSQRQKEKQLQQTVTKNHGRQVLLRRKISFLRKER